MGTIKRQPDAPRSSAALWNPALGLKMPLMTIDERVRMATLFTACTIIQNDLCLLSSCILVPISTVSPEISDEAAVPGC